MANVFLFIGAILVAYQYVGDIGYLATLLSAPFGLTIKPLMKRLGLDIKKSNNQLSFQTRQLKVKRPMIQQITLWFFLLFSIILFAFVTLITQPIMVAYWVIGIPLMNLNKLLNLVYEEFFSQWQDIYLVTLRNSLTIRKKYFGITTKKANYSDHELLDIRKKKGELPFLGFLGLLFILAGFVLQVGSSK